MFERVITEIDQYSYGIARLLVEKKTFTTVVAVVACTALAEFLLIGATVGLPAAHLVALNSLGGRVLMYGAPILGLLILAGAIAIIVNLGQESPKTAQVDEELGSLCCVSLKKESPEQKEEIECSKTSSPDLFATESLERKEEETQCSEKFSADLEAQRLLMRFYPLGRVDKWAEPQRIEIAKKLLEWTEGVFWLLSAVATDDPVRCSNLSILIEWGVWRAEALSLTLSYLKSDDLEPCRSLQGCKQLLYQAKSFLPDQDEKADIFSALSCIASAQEEFSHVKREFERAFG